MLSANLEFNRKLIGEICLYRYPLMEQEGDGVDLTWCVIIDDNKIERKGDDYPIYEVPSGKIVLLDEFVWCPVSTSVETFVGGSVGRITTEGQYHITLNVVSRSLETPHMSLRRPIPYFSGEWIAACPHLLGKKERSAFRMTMRFRELLAPKNARIGEVMSLISNWD